MIHVNFFQLLNVCYGCAGDSINYILVPINVTLLSERLCISNIGISKKHVRKIAEKLANLKN